MFVEMIRYNLVFAPTGVVLFANSMRLADREEICPVSIHKQFYKNHRKQAMTDCKLLSKTLNLQNSVIKRIANILLSYQSGYLIFVQLGTHTVVYP